MQLCIFHRRGSFLGSVFEFLPTSISTKNSVGVYDSARQHRERGISRLVRQVALGELALGGKACPCVFYLQWCEARTKKISVWYLKNGDS